MELRYPLLNMEPAIAIPITAPSSRRTSLRADATPCFSKGNEETIISVAGGDANPIPAP